MQMQARTVGSSKILTDLAEGDALGTLLGTTAEEISSNERKLQEWHAAYFLDATGTDLDDRVAQLPKEFPRRRGPRAASGGLVSVTRVSSVGTLTIPAGGLVVGRSDLANVFYVNTEDISWIDGQSVAPGMGQDPIRVRCVSRGTLGNGDAGVIDIVRSPTDTIRAVSSSQPLTLGSDGEDDTNLRRRARLWLNSLTGWTTRAIEGLAINFTDSNNESILHARAFTDPARPGYTELVVDNGYGMVGYTRTAVTRTGTIPTLVSGTRHQFWFDYPAVGDIRIVVDGAPRGPSSTDWIALLERGVMITAVTPSEPFTAGDTWSISGHQVFTGVIAELQDYLDNIAVGAGLRVRVVPPRVQYVTLSANVVTVGQNRVGILAAVKKAIIAFCVGLRPGDPLVIFQLCAELEKIRGVLNVVFDQTDRYCGSLRDKLACTDAHITLR